MIKKLSLFVLVIVLCSMVPAPGQAARAASDPDAASQMGSLRVGDPAFPSPVEVRYDPDAAPLKVDPLPSTDRPGLQPASLNITVDYVAAGVENALGDMCLTYPEAAKTAFTAAANILQSYISSPVPIRIEACWTNLPQYVLGHSSALMFYHDFLNAPYPNLYYPVALANAFTGTDLDPATACTGSGFAASNCDDISLAYADAYLGSFYFGTDGAPGGSQIDFESVVLHEIIHGLGFSGRLYAYKIGSTWYGNLNQALIPFIYDKFASNSAGVSLTNTGAYPRPGTALGTVLVGGSGGAYSNGLNTRYANGGAGAKLYTPNPWAAGSSYSHLDETFNGTPNDLMTYSIGNGQSLHAPGPVGYGVLKDMGWAPQPATALSAAWVNNQANLTWTNNAGAPTGFRIERSPTGSDPWASVGTAGSTATSYSDINLPPGEYLYRVIAYNSLGDAYPSNVSNIITILPPPTGLSATPISSTQIHLAWTNNLYANPSSMAARVQRSPTGAAGSWTNLTTSAPAGSQAGSYNDNGPLTEGAHYFYQVMVQMNSSESLPSNIADTWTYLTQPTNLTAAAASDTQINLTWKHNSAAATAYTVKRGTDGVNFPVTVTTTAPKGATVGSTTSYSDTGPLTEGTLYYYQVIATNATPAVSLPSAAASAGTYLKSPTGLTATPISTTQINLSWTDNSAAAAAYTIKRGADGTTFPTTLITTFPPGTPGLVVTYPDGNSVTEGVRYYYQVIATNPSPASSQPVTVNATALLATPTGLATSAAPTYTQVSLTWTNNSAHQTGYDIYRSDSVPTAFVLKGHSSATTYNDTSVVAGMLYHYIVCATNATGASADSGLLPVVTPQVPPTLFTAVRAGEKVNLSWHDNAANETGYTVERSLDGITGWVAAGTASLVPGVDGSGSFTDNDPFELVSQYYRICAVNAATCSAYVESAVVPAGATLNAPTPVFSVVMADPAKIKIRWTDNSTDESGYQVQYSDSPSGPWTDMVADTGSNVTSFDWVIPDGVYYVQVRALNADPALDSPFTMPVRVVKSSTRIYLPVVAK